MDGQMQQDEIYVSSTSVYYMNFLTYINRLKIKSIKLNNLITSWAYE